MKELVTAAHTAFSDFSSAVLDVLEHYIISAD